MADDDRPHDGTIRTLQPDGWAAPRGYANGMAGRGTWIATGGQVGWDSAQRFTAATFVGQAEQALANVLAVVRAGGGQAHHIVRLTWYVLDIAAYRACLPELGQAYRRVMGRHYPAMTLVQVAGLVEDQALLEIEGTAVLPDGA